MLFCRACSPRPSSSRLLLSRPTASADTFEVGPGRTYDTLQDVERLVDPGDLVLLDGGNTYPGGVVFDRNGTAALPITIRGVGGARPHIGGGTNTVEAQGDHYVVRAARAHGRHLALLLPPRATT